MATTLDILDFRSAPFGLLVRYSDHYEKEHCINRRTAKGKAEMGKIGMVVDLKFFQDAIGRVVCWPVVRWEGSPTETICHPINVVPYRKNITLRPAQMTE